MGYLLQGNEIYFGGSWNILFLKAWIKHESELCEREGSKHTK